MRINFGSCNFEWFASEDCGVTRFSDGLELAAAPGNDAADRVIARRLGYPETPEGLSAMCREHEVIHTLLAVLSGLPWSPTLHHEAAMRAGLPGECDVDARVNEESRVLAVQAAINGVSDG